VSVTITYFEVPLHPGAAPSVLGDYQPRVDGQGISLSQRCFFGGVRSKVFNNGISDVVGDSKSASGYFLLLISQYDQDFTVRWPADAARPMRSSCYGNPLPYPMPELPGKLAGQLFIAVKDKLYNQNLQVIYLRQMMNLNMSGNEIVALF
jgi:hypothetical protein